MQSWSLALVDDSLAFPMSANGSLVHLMSTKDNRTWQEIEWCIADLQTRGFAKLGVV